MATLSPFAPTRRLVLKIGSALLVDPNRGALRKDWLSALTVDIQALHEDGVEIIIVSSGAIALGRGRLSLMGHDLTLPQKQACAAAGQSLLTGHYEQAFAAHGLKTAQALLTLNDTENRRRWLNARSTLETLLSLGVIPIINENDTVSTTEIRYGDNDRLAARTAQMIGADTLILLSDINGLYNRDPQIDKTAQHIPIIDSLTDEVMQMGGEANARQGLGTGGMATKLLAAQIAMGAGCHMAIMDGRVPGPISRMQSGETLSWFRAATTPKNARQQWIAGTLKPQGDVTIDSGAIAALGQGKSLLAAGVTAVSGHFGKGDCVQIQIIGKRSQDAVKTLGYDKIGPLIHRDNLIWHGK